MLGLHLWGPPAKGAARRVLLRPRALFPLLSGRSAVHTHSISQKKQIWCLAGFFLQLLGRHRLAGYVSITGCRRRSPPSASFLTGGGGGRAALQHRPHPPPARGWGAAVRPGSAAVRPGVLRSGLGMLRSGPWNAAVRTGSAAVWPGGFVASNPANGRSASTVPQPAAGLTAPSIPYPQGKDGDFNPSFTRA